MREQDGHGDLCCVERLVKGLMDCCREPLVLTEDSQAYKLSRRGQFVPSLFPDKNVDGSSPLDEIDPNPMGILLNRKIYRSLSDLKVCDGDVLKKFRQKRCRKLNDRVMSLNGEAEARL